MTHSQTPVVSHYGVSIHKSASIKFVNGVGCQIHELHIPIGIVSMPIFSILSTSGQSYSISISFSRSKSGDDVTRSQHLGGIDKSERRVFTQREKLQLIEAGSCPTSLDGLLHRLEPPDPKKVNPTRAIVPRPPGRDIDSVNMVDS
jgi:hypothetical protein